MAVFWELPPYGSRSLGPDGPEKAALRLRGLRGAAGPDVLNRHGEQMKLPVVITPTKTVGFVPLLSL